MKAAIEVANKQEADAIKVALLDVEVRTSVVVYGMLKALDDEQRARVIRYVIDRLGISL